MKAKPFGISFSPFWKLKLQSKELYDSIADVPTNGAFAGNEANGEPRPPASLQAGAASFVHRQRSFEFVLKPWTGGIFDGQFRAKLKFFLGRDRSIASKNVHGLPNIRNFQVHFPPRNAIIQFILLINKFVARESNCFVFIYASTILIYKFKTIR